MYPKKQPKSDREKFYGAFQKKVGCKPEQYLRRKLAGGMPEAELRRLYDMLAGNPSGTVLTVPLFENIRLLKAAQGRR